MSGKKDGMKSRFPMSVFWIVLGTLLLTAGLHTGLLLGMRMSDWSPLVQVHITIFYWIGVSFLLTWIIRVRMRNVYEIPLQMISAATKKVARGDFTVQITPLHSEDKYDYLDHMILDLNRMITELRSIETLKTDFISNVSHEIKTPIAVIQNYGRLLQSDFLSDSERKEYAQTISDAAMRLSGLITSILKLNRLENQQILPKTEEFDLGGQITECLLGFENVWEEKNIEIEPDIEDGILVSTDKELLSIVWNNLLSNAFKFTETGGTVSVTLKAENHEAVVSVRDTGCGITPEAAKHIFDKFYQEDSSHATQGNGLGLALVKRIIDIVDGKITVDSVPGKGSCFIVRLKMSE